MRRFRIWLAKRVAGEGAIVIPRHKVEPLRAVPFDQGFGASNCNGVEAWPELVEWPAGFVTMESASSKAEWIPLGKINLREPT